MAADYLPNIPDASLIAMYELIGDMKLNDSEYLITEYDMLVISAISKRKLTHKTRYKYGLPRSKEWQ